MANAIPLIADVLATVLASAMIIAPMSGKNMTAESNKSNLPRISRLVHD